MTEINLILPLLIQVYYPILIDLWSECFHFFPESISDKILTVIISSSLWFFHTSFNWRLGGSKSSHAYTSLFGILSNFNCSAASTLSILPWIPSLSSFFFRLLETVPSAPTTIGIYITMIFNSSLNSLARFSFSLAFPIL